MSTALALPAYEAPALVWEVDPPAERAEVLWWVVFVGFAFSVAMAYAAYCTYSGGSPEISLTWKGFKVSCYR